MTFVIEARVIYLGAEGDNGWFEREVLGELKSKIECTACIWAIGLWKPWLGNGRIGRDRG